MDFSIEKWKTVNKVMHSKYEIIEPKPPSRVRCKVSHELLDTLKDGNRTNTRNNSLLILLLLW